MPTILQRGNCPCWLRKVGITAMNSTKPHFYRKQMGGKETGYSVVPHQATLVLYCVYSSAQHYLLPTHTNFFFIIIPFYFKIEILAIRTLLWWPICNKGLRRDHRKSFLWAQRLWVDRQPIDLWLYLEKRRKNSSCI